MKMNAAELPEEKCSEITAFTTSVNKETCVHEYIEEKNAFLRQLWAYSVCLILNIIAGSVSGYTAILLPQLDDKNSTIRATPNQQSWIASMAPLSMALGCISSGWSMEYFGRKKTLVLCSLIFLVGWGLICISKQISALLLGRLITGFSVGYLGPTGSCYIGEISTPKYRGIFLSGISLGFATGYLVTHILGTFLDWRTVALIICAGPIIVFLVIIPVPESHVWLLRHRSFREANLAFEWYSDTDKHLDSALCENIDRAEEENEDQACAPYFRKDFVKPVMIMILFFVTTQFSGNNTVGFYTVGIMQKTVPSLNEYAAMLIMDVMRFIMSIIACILTKRCGTRVLTFVSATGTVLSLFLLATFVHLSDLYPENSIFTTVPLGFLLGYVAFISIGIVPLPWSLSGELLPPRNKGVGGGIATSINFLTFFLVIKTSPDLFAIFGTAVTFAIFGAITLLLSAILYLVLPETKNKTLEEIQSSLK